MAAYLNAAAIIEIMMINDNNSILSLPSGLA
jgi:hypothetical protein